MTTQTASTKAGMLRRPGEFEAVLKAGLRVSSRNFVARARANSTLHPRLGMIAGKKAAPRAVDRNRAKRFIRETFRDSSARIGAFDVTVQLRSDLRGQENSGVRAELQQLFEAVARRCAASKPDMPAVHPTLSPPDRP